MASSINPQISSQSANTVSIKMRCVADSDGTFSDYTLDKVDGYEYWGKDYRIANLSAKNPASTYPTVAATVTVTDADGKQLVGSTAGDTLALSTSASGIAMLSVSRSGGQRIISSKLTFAIGDTGSAANIFDLILELERY